MPYFTKILVQLVTCCPFPRPCLGGCCSQVGGLTKLRARPPQRLARIRPIPTHVPDAA